MQINSSREWLLVQNNRLVNIWSGLPTVMLFFCELLVLKAGCWYVSFCFSWKITHLESVLHPFISSLCWKSFYFICFLLSSGFWPRRKGTGFDSTLVLFFISRKNIFDHLHPSDASWEALELVQWLKLGSPYTVAFTKTRVTDSSN